MKIIPILISIFTLALVSNAQEPIFVTDSGTVNPWNNLNFNNDSMDFNFAIVADNTGNSRDGVLATAFDKINQMQPEFVISVGDLIEGNTYDKTKLYKQWNTFDSLTNTLEMPFFYVPGNHDNDNEAMAEVWNERLGKSYYHFKYKNTLFLMLNSQDGTYGRIGEKQIAYAKSVLEKNNEVRHTYVFIHQPLWKSRRLNGWKEIEKLLAPIKHTVFCGHIHSYSITKINDNNYITLATTGGGIGNPAKGKPFDLIVWASMRGDKSRESVIELDAIHKPSFSNVESHNLTEIEIKEGVEISYLPIYFDDVFKKGTSTITIENKTDFNITCNANFTNDNNIQAKLKETYFNMLPHTKKEVKFSLIAKYKSSKPILFNLTSQVQGKATSTKSIEVQAVKKYNSNKLPSNTSIKDINFNDTEAKYPFYGTDISGESDNSFRFTTTYDDKYVYVNVQVVDSQIITGQAIELWGMELLYDYRGNRFKSDAIEIKLNAQPDPIRAQSTGWHAFQQHLLVAIEPSQDKNNSKLLFEDKLPKDFKYSYKLTDNGYNVTCYFPIDYLKKMQGKSVNAYRLNVVLHNRNSTGDFYRTEWRPDWRSSKTIVGSGTFFMNK